MFLGNMKTPARRRKPLLVGIVGGSGSGKSWLADQLQRRFGKESNCLRLDDFYLDRSHLSVRQRARLNFDHPRAIDWPLLRKAVQACAPEKMVLLPRYDFTDHTRRAQPKTWRSKPLVIVEGLWLLRTAELRRHFALTIFLDCPEELRLKRRLRRDVAQRGRTESSVRDQFYTRVLPMHRRHVAPQQRWADVVLSTPPDARVIDQLVERIRKLFQ